MAAGRGGRTLIKPARRAGRLAVPALAPARAFFATRQQHQLIDLSVMEFFGVSKNEQAQEFWVTCQKEISAPGCLVIAKFTLDQEVEALKELVRIYKILGEIY